MATGVFTANATGVYLITWQFGWTNTGSPVLIGQINLNAVTAIVLDPGTATAPIKQTIVYPLTAGDTIIFRATRDATANSLNGIASATFGSIARIG